MQFCPKCGRKLDDDATFCSECGFDIKNNKSQQLNHQIMRFYEIMGLLLVD